MNSLGAAIFSGAFLIFAALWEVADAIKKLAKALGEQNT